VYNEVAAREGIEDPVIHKDGLDMVMNRIKEFVNGTIITIEERFRVITDTGVVLIGAMDKVERVNNDTVLVTDYKTSKYFESGDELKSDIQLSIYDLVASILFSDYKRIILSLDYLRGEPVYTYRTLDERAVFLEYVTAIYNKMLELRKEEAVPTLNSMCNWCDFTDNCSVYNDAISSKTFIKRKPEDYSDEDLIAEYEDIQNKKRIIDKREKSLRKYILDKINYTGKNVVANGVELYPKQRLMTTYDPKTLYENVPIDKFLQLVSVSKYDVDRYLKEDPTIKPYLTETAVKKYTSPFLGVKSIKK